MLLAADPSLHGCSSAPRDAWRGLHGIAATGIVISLNLMPPLDGSGTAAIARAEGRVHHDRLGQRQGNGAGDVGRRARRVVGERELNGTRGTVWSNSGGGLFDSGSTPVEGRALVHTDPRTPSA